MKNNKNPSVKRYLKEISAVIVCPKGTKGFFMRELKQDVLSYAQEHNDITFEMLCKAFGAPEKFTAGLADDEVYANYLKIAKKKAKIWKWIGISAIVLALIAIGLCIFTYIKFGGTVEVTNPTEVKGVFI